MIELFYDSQALACFILQNELGQRACMDLLKRVYEEDAEFLHPDYRGHEKALVSDVLYWVDYLTDKVTIDREFPAIEKDFTNTGHMLVKENIVSEYPGFDMFFMSMRLKLRFLEPRGYTRLKLRTLLKGYGYKRRTAALVEHIRDCIYFYHIEPALRGGEACDIREIDIDDMITFRIL